jgi:hypothetical protein
VHAVATAAAALPPSVGAAVGAAVVDDQSVDNKDRLNDEDDIDDVDDVKFSMEMEELLAVVAELIPCMAADWVGSVDALKRRVFFAPTAIVASPAVDVDGHVILGDVVAPVEPRPACMAPACLLNQAALQDLEVSISGVLFVCFVRVFACLFVCLFYCLLLLFLAVCCLLLFVVVVVVEN